MDRNKLIKGALYCALTLFSTGLILILVALFKMDSYLASYFLGVNVRNNPNEIWALTHILMTGATVRGIPTSAILTVNVVLLVGIYLSTTSLILIKQGSSPRLLITRQYWLDFQFHTVKYSAPKPKKQVKSRATKLQEKLNKKHQTKKH